MQDSPAIVVSCYDGYSWLWPGFRYYLKRYMEFQAPVYLASVSGNASGGDTSFLDIAVGDGEWSGRLLSALNQIKETHVFTLLDDDWICKPWSRYQWDKMCIKHWDMPLTHAVRWFERSPLSDFDGDKYAQDSKYTVSFRPTMWKKDVLSSILVPEESAWQGEVVGSGRLNKMYNPHYIYIEDWYGYENVYQSTRGKKPGLTEKGQKMFDALKPIEE